MRKWAVIYSSTTGNTKAIAEEIAGTAGADLFRVQDAPTDLSAYDVVALGYWLRRGGARRHLVRACRLPARREH